MCSPGLALAGQVISTICWSESGDAAAKSSASRVASSDCFTMLWRASSVAGSWCGMLMLHSRSVSLWGNTRGRNAVSLSAPFYKK
jgi:hypothetical protein